MNIFAQLFVSLDPDYSEKDLALFLIDKGWDTDMVATFLDDLFQFTLAKDALNNFEDALCEGLAKAIPKEN